MPLPIVRANQSVFDFWTGFGHSDENGRFSRYTVTEGIETAYPMVAPPRSTQNKIVVKTESAKSWSARERASQRNCLSNSA